LDVREHKSHEHKSERGSQEEGGELCLHLKGEKGSERPKEKDSSISSRAFASLAEGGERGGEERERSSGPSFEKDEQPPARWEIRNPIGKNLAKIETSETEKQGAATAPSPRAADSWGKFVRLNGKNPKQGTISNTEKEKGGNALLEGTAQFSPQRAFHRKAKITNTKRMRPTGPLQKADRAILKREPRKGKYKGSPCEGKREGRKTSRASLRKAKIFTLQNHIRKLLQGKRGKSTEEKNSLCRPEAPDSKLEADREGKDGCRTK